MLLLARRFLFICLLLPPILCLVLKIGQYFQRSPLVWVTGREKSSLVESEPFVGFLRTEPRAVGRIDIPRPDLAGGNVLAPVHGHTIWRTNSNLDGEATASLVELERKEMNSRSCRTTKMWE